LSTHNKHDDDDYYYYDFLFIGLGIGVIYGGYEGYRYPHFSGRESEEFAVTAVNRGDLWILNYNKTVFGPRWESSSRPLLGGGILPPHSPHDLLLNWYPSILDQSYAPGPPRPTCRPILLFSLM